ncbi:MAG: bifunctional diaminohydroxyphosphoribosylaminopyrimidine deaminase/5-amino-6-(5-phosphoribosylamino)uracil reductase RibD [Acidimicrobiales bacterium]
MTDAEPTPGHDEQFMGRAVAAAARARARTSPNPWVGAVLVTPDGERFEGSTEPPGGRHAEIVAVDAARAAGADPAGATLYVTLEPCCHQGRTAPCTDAIVAARIGRVVVGIEDPDPNVQGKGLATLRAAGIETAFGVCSDAIHEQLAPYIKHRRTGRPWVVLKLAATLDGRTAAPDGTSQWITGSEARADAHRLRAESDAVIVGAGTVRADDPALTVRHVDGRDPLRVVLGHVPVDARVHPALELSGPLDEVLTELGDRGVVQALVEGGATVAGAFHRAGLVDRYVVYVAPALFGGEDARGLFAGPGASTMADLWRGRIISIERLGADLKVEMEDA